MDTDFRELLEGEGVAAAVSYYHQHRELHPAVPLWAERQMNALGYEYLRSGRLEAAIALFTLNVEAYPEASNTYDSLGEAYMEAGQHEEAVANYQRSLELDPENDNAVRMLQRMGEDADAAP
jgi:tetratricopeptide (TPR) repeat protein